MIDRGGVRFDINRDHPSIKTLISRLSKSDASDFDSVLAVIESSFPADALYSRMASDLRSSFNGEEVTHDCGKLLDHCLLRLTPSPLRKTLLATLHLIEPFNLHPEATRKIVEEIQKDD